jgi:predicted metal-binding protein
MPNVIDYTETSITRKLLKTNLCNRCNRCNLNSCVYARLTRTSLYKTSITDDYDYKLTGGVNWLW